MSRIITTKKAPKPIGPYSQGIMKNNFLFISGQIPIDVRSGCIPNNISEQTHVVLTNIKSIILKANYQMKDIVKITIFTTHLKKIQIINEIYEKFFTDNQSFYPARSCVEVRELPKNVKIEIEAIAIKNK
ncbi:hypothetical protein DD681_01190 [Buchnera aphidicola (Melanaphis sacchari)]|uniref:2-iminobutanoate/2-iminopropanoate deaminase n=1 Tax=Buchnera aphidicola (Melanaphis sacchari) TaxID=2173854 RepID=A0A2U8DGL9_9GAMM|nr:Rid family detoxifying hydrolase [Buchnera aphidicola]AWH90424.1 hypothetical protein DD681_01190 [Buchnera aphidicola (Melanaphis sacchari)]